MTEQPNTNKTHIVFTCKRVSGPSGLKIRCLNNYSLTHHFDELNMFLDEDQPHIMALNETKLDHNDPTYVINHSFYSSIGPIVEIFLPAMRDIKITMRKFVKPRVSIDSGMSSCSNVCHLSC